MSYDPDARRDTPLALKLKSRIAERGPMPVKDYIAICLQDPEHGYYRTKAVIGAQADFITAPEISQIFGELIGLWAAVVWRQMGVPAKFNLIELGPGRGTMLRDALRAANTVAGFREAASVQVVEPSEHLRGLQRETLNGLSVRHLHPSELPSGPTIVLANEVLDCIPIWQLQWAETATGCASWHKRMVGLDAGNRLSFVLGDPVALRPGAPVTLPAAQTGDILEDRNCRGIIEGIAAPATAAPVAALLIDYGHTASAFGDSLQAVRNHAYEHPLTSPGEADLTAQVDFAAFGHTVQEINGKSKLAQAHLVLDGPTTQAEFLGSLGIVERASRLMSANPGRAGEIEAGVARLIAPTGMGTRFKVIGVRSPHLPPLPGFGN